MKIAWTRRILMLGMILAVVVAFSGLLWAEETVKCPVSGKEIKKAEAPAKLEYKEKTYYFCCSDCKDAFLKNPEKYIKRLQDPGHEHEEQSYCEQMQAKSGEDAEIADPVCGMKIEPSEAAAKVEHNGRTYYFCMESCKEKFLENPEKYIKAADEMVKCPVMGTEIKKSEAAGSSEYKGETYYFCCSGCKTRFDENPEKYARKK